MQFKDFKAAVAKQYAKLQQTGQLLRAETDRDVIWSKYIDTFPEGSNPIHIKRTEHDCSCCKSFIRTIGNVVAEADGSLQTIWDITIDDPAFQAVADSLSTYVKSCPIINEFLHYEAKVGVDQNRQLLENKVTTYEHFYVTVDNKFVKRKDAIDTELSISRTKCQVFKRALEEISPSAIDTVLDLIAQNSLYRGEEHKAAVLLFKNLRQESIGKLQDGIWTWRTALASGNAPAVHIRNSVIGTLLVDLSEGKDLEDAVKAYEAKVAPTNYKRPTALITKAMITRAQETITELGLASALGRRYAKLDDITVNNILFANREANKVIGGDVFDMLKDKAADKVPNLDKVEEINIEDFISNVLPTVTTVEVLLENQHANNLVSLIAPEDPTSGHLFKWDNNFSWSYAGEVTDAIKERVKAAGGNVTGDFCCRLAWYNHDDLDFHMREPGYEIYFRNKRQLSPAGGMLDVDMNAGHGTTREPVENIFYTDINRMRPGTYTLQVNQYNCRETRNTGFDVQIDILGTVYHYHQDKSPRSGTVDIATFIYSKNDGLKLVTDLEGFKTVKTLWNLPTQSFHNVTIAMLSPNYWDQQQSTGNKHYFFMLENCINPDASRGFYNEFLRGDLNEHRKVFEIVGSTIKAEASPQQLSGLGFSSTQRSSVVVKVTGSFTRMLKINF